MQYSAYMDTLLSDIGARLRARRVGLGLTQAALAAAAGVSPRFLVQLEGGSGNISVARLAEVCAALDIRLDALFTGLGPGRPDKVALVGLRGAGKSTVGAALAERLGWDFVELDGEVEAEAGMSLGEIFELHGEGEYRALELAVLRRVLDRAGPAVIAAGGSIVKSGEAWRLLREGARTVWLQATPDAHLERVRAQGDLRPMRGWADPRAVLDNLLNERASLYGQAELCLDTDALGVAGVVDAIART
jgi:XRE family aerobic/anaerobic benzoate catabolism transcriptional regulator